MSGFSDAPRTAPRKSWTFDDSTLSEIRRAAATGIYDIRGGGSKRRLPHFDDLVLLGASMSRYPLEGYREKCGTDIVLGDRFGSSADPRLMSRIERSFRAQGFTVARNAPYAGGYTTRRYGRPRRGIHALQVEINRGLYMDEQRITRASGFAALKDALQQVMAEIIEAARLLPRA
jgi:N-formylglutamate amidohydrolase